MHKFKEIIKLGKDIITSKDAARAFGDVPKKVADDLARFVRQGRLLRIKRGHYMIVPLEAMQKEEAFDDPWLAASSIFSKAYVGGWSALEYHGLTEQIFRNTCIISTIAAVSSHNILQYEYLYKKIPEHEFFGTEIVWRKNTKILVSDIHKTVIDILKYPELGGDIRHIIASVSNYLASDKKDMLKLAQYAVKSGGGALLKRLGFILELILGEENQHSKMLLREIKIKSYSYLDYRIPCEVLNAKWKLYVPEQIDNVVDKKMKDINTK